MSRDLARLVSNLIRLGTIAHVDQGAARCRVASGDLTTDWIPWLAMRAGETVAWSSPSIGEQVVLLSPEGDPANAIALCGLYTDAVPAPASAAGQTVVTFADGAVLRYDADAHALDAVLPSGGQVTITADGGVTINGPLTVNGDTQINGNTGIDGDASVTGTATADTDVIGAGKSLKSHKHTGVQTGGGISGPPQ